MSPQCNDGDSTYRISARTVRFSNVVYIPPLPLALIISCIPCPSKEDAFAWSDPDVAGSKLDPQTADFARRAAELWVQAVGLRERCANQKGVREELRHRQDGATVDHANDTETLARVVEQVRLVYPFRMTSSCDENLTPSQNTNKPVKFGKTFQYKRKQTRGG